MEPGGFGETLGNDVSQLGTAVEADRLGAESRARQRDAGRAYPRRPSARSVGCAAGEGRARRAKPAHWRSRPDGTDPDPRRGRARHHSCIYPIDGEVVIDKPGKGAFYATELGDILQKYSIENLLVCGVTTEVCVNTTVREATTAAIDASCCQTAALPIFLNSMGIQIYGFWRSIASFRPQCRPAAEGPAVRGDPDRHPHR